MRKTAPAGVFDISATVRHPSPMDAKTHAPLLRQAMAEKGLSNQAVADATGMRPRTVTNWRIGETMPSDREMAALRKLLGPYDTAGTGDAVERALRGSELTEWRKDAVVSFYKKNLYEQAAEQAG